MPTHADLTQQLKEKDRRLQQLKLKEARFGYNTPPEVLIEIEDLQAETETLRRQLSTLKTAPIAPNSPEEFMEPPRAYPNHLVRWGRQAWLASDLAQNGQYTGSQYALLNAAGQALWSAELPGLLITGGASPDNARLVFSAQSIIPVEAGGSVRCLNRAGAELWQWQSNTSAVSAPVIFAGAIWVTLNTGALVSLDPANGREIARRPLPHSPSTAAPLMADGVAYIPGNGPQVMAVSLDGAVRWVYTATAGSLIRTPVIIGEAIIAANANGEQSRIIALNRAGGRELWQTPLPTGEYGFSPPATDGRRVFIGGKRGLFALNPADGAVAWSFPTPDKYFLAAPVVVGETVFAACRDHRLYAFEAATGSLRWSSSPVSRRLEVAPAILPGEPPVALIADRSGAVTAFGLPFAITKTPPQPEVSPMTEPALSPSQRRQLEQRRADLQVPFETWNKRIAALLKDISRALEEERKVILEERLVDLKKKRDSVQAELDDIEMQLAGATPRDGILPEGYGGSNDFTYSAVDKKLVKLMDSIALVYLPQIIGGKEESLVTGTAWLIAPGLAITCNHVIQNRPFAATPAPADLEAQLAQTHLLFDHDQPAEGIAYGVVALVHHHNTLDYAILRLQDRADHPLSRRPCFVPELDPPLNGQTRLLILQHPQGQIQQRADGHFVKTEGDRITYTTATDHGTSGGPVLLYSTWRVTALHCGKSKTEHQNEGVRLRAIFDDLQQTQPALYQEIITAT